MSASREKKERQDLFGQGPTQKQLREEKAAKAAKTKTVVYSVIGIVVALLVVALLVWSSGFFQRKVTAATVGDESFSVADMQYYYSQAMNTELYQIRYNEQLSQAYGFAYESPYDFEKSASEQIFDKESGQTYAEHFKENALKTLTQITALVHSAEAEQFALSQDGKDQLDQQLDELDKTATTNGYPNRKSFLSANYGKYVTPSVYKTHLSNAILAQEYLTSHEDSLVYTEDQLNAYQKENPSHLNNYDFRLCYIDGAAPTTTDADGNAVAATEEESATAMTAAKKKADGLVADVTAAAGDKAQAFGTSAASYVEDTSAYAKPEGTIQAGILGDKLFQQGAPYADWLTDSARVKGDVSAIESGSGYYVVLFETSYLGTTPTVDIRHILIKGELTKDNPDTADVDESATAPNEEQLAAAKAEAERILADWKAGEKTADSFAKLATEFSQDAGSKDEGGQYKYVEKNQMFDTFDAWIYDPARAPGDVELIENTQAGQQGWHVVYFQGAAGPKWHDIATQAKVSADMESWLADLEAPYTATFTSGMDNVA